MRLVVACEDAGGAAALAPVLRELTSRGDQLEFRLGEVAAQTLAGRGISFVKDGPSPLEGATALLTATTSWGQRIEARAVLEARAMRVPSLGLLDFWSNYESRLSFPGATGLAAMPDRLAVIDTIMARDLAAVGVPPDRMVVTGSPAFDDLLLRRASAQACEQDQILFLSQPMRALYGSSLGFTERTVLSALAPAASSANMDLCVRPHPREDAAELAAFVATLPCRGRVASAGALWDAIATARVVVGMTSVALVEAALLGARVISAQLDRVGPDALPTNASGITIGVTTAEELQRLVGAAARGDFVRPVAADGALWPPGATARVIGALDTLLAQPR